MSSNTPWFLVSKPVRAPFRDGTTVLVRNLITGLSPTIPVSYFGDPAAPVRSSADRVIPMAPMGLAPGLISKAALLRHLVDPRRRRQPLHLFFTPNRVTSRVLSALRRANRKRVFVQTLTSSVGVERFAPLLRHLDAVVALSAHTEQALLAAGLATDRVHRIYPGVGLADLVLNAPRPRRVLYAGDLDEEIAKSLLTLAAGLTRPSLDGWTLVVACRPKTPESRVIAEDLRAAFAAEATGRVEVLGEVQDMDALFRRCAVQVFVASHLRNKMDLPLVLLEGMSRGLGVLCLDAAPVNEIVSVAKERGLEPGACVESVDDLVEALEEAASSDLLLRWATDARRLVEMEFSLGLMAERYALLYQRL